MANPASDIIAAKRAHEKCVYRTQRHRLFFAVILWRINRYLDMDPTFQDTRECQLVAKLLQVQRGLLTLAAASL